MARRQRRARSTCSGIRKQGQSNFRDEALRKKTLTLVADAVECGGCGRFAAAGKSGVLRWHAEEASFRGQSFFSQGYRENYSDPANGLRRADVARRRFVFN
ncbi:hypothetical protein GCM10022212_08800 [Actimicrobium antarcticum]|uniref:Uncharacterized protein n=1 Tax=Actimicrobium antarcticum TaxID=1051899 RepID=A0ABP7SSP5_9BURK